MNDDPIRTIYESARTIAVVGCSRSASKAAHRIPSFLQEMGHRIVPINPHADGQILDERVHDSLQSASSELDEKIDVVDVFRPAEEAPDIAQQAVEIGADVLWLQLGIRSEQARSIAEDAGLRFVQDHCMKPEYIKRFGDEPRDFDN